MQQQLPQQDHYGNHQQMAQPMVLCPIQYVYETPMIVQQGIPEDQVQPNQVQPYLLNVQNPPPWINRQNLLYLQPNVQPVYHHNIIPNQLYQNINYQIPQMIIPQEIRPVQNLSYNSEEHDRMPLLTHMLKTNQTRPIMQNQQVQTDISSGKCNPRPQVITINPMQQRFQKDVIISRPRQEMPNHIRHKIPNSISVKTIFRPILPRPLIRGYDANNVYYNNYVNIPENTINTENTQINVKPPEIKKFKNEECQTVKAEIGTVKASNQAHTRVEVKPNEVTRDVAKSQTNTRTFDVKPNEIGPEKAKFNQVHSKAFDIKPNEITHERTKFSNETNFVFPANNQRQAPVKETQTEEKLIRNTVFVQARGRVLEKEIVINTLKRTLDDRLQENIAKNISNHEFESPNKYIKLEPQNNLSNNNCAKIPNVPFVTKNQQLSVSDNPNKVIEVKPDIKSMTDKVPEFRIKPQNVTNNVSELNDLKTKLSNIEQKEIKETIENDKNLNEVDTQKITNEMKGKSANVSKEDKLKDKHKRDVVVLTHVLDGHIIQESNVAFPIQKPSKETEKDKYSHKTSPKSGKIDQRDVIPHLPHHHLADKMDQAEVAVKTDKDNTPFADVQKSVVRSWTTDQLADHLCKYDWKETASKLLDQEIDGESILLVNKDQLVVIGVCEKHADLISAFVSKN